MGSIRYSNMRNIRWILELIFFNIRSVSWIRGADSHIITVDQETFISDDRFSSLIKARENLWTLKVTHWPNCPLPVGGGWADLIFADQVREGPRRWAVWVSSEHGAQDEQEGGAGGCCAQGGFPLSLISLISSLVYITISYHHTDPIKYYLVWLGLSRNRNRNKYL